MITHLHPSSAHGFITLRDSAGRVLAGPIVMREGEDGLLVSDVIELDGPSSAIFYAEALLTSATQKHRKGKS